MNAGAALRTALLAAALVVAPVGAGGNPVPGPDVTRRFHVLVTGFVQSPSDARRQALVDTLKSYPFTEMADSTRAVIEAHQEVFLPLLAESQEFPAHIRPAMFDWLRSRATVATREAMLAVLRERLCTPERLLADHEKKWDDEDADSAARRRWRREETRVVAAELLSAWGDSLALPLIRARQDSIVRKGGGWDGMSELAVRYWWYLAQAALRIRDPLASAIAVVVDDGRVAVQRGVDEVGSARYCRGDCSDVVVAPGEIDQLLKLLPLSTGAISCAETYNSSSPEVYVDFMDGAMMCLRSVDGPRILYYDNLSSRQPGFEFENPQIHRILADIRARAEADWGGETPAAEARSLGDVGR